MSAYMYVYLNIIVRAVLFTVLIISFDTFESLLEFNFKKLINILNKFIAYFLVNTLYIMMIRIIF